MIYTLTTNPAVDMNVNADTLTTKKVNRTRDAVYTPNGKGLNVSFTLRHYGVDSVILGFFGGFSGDYIVREAERRCPVRPVQIDGITRVNIFVTTPEGEYKFPNAGAPVSREKQLEMLELLRGLDDLECLVVSGSLSPEMGASYYDELIDVCQEKGAEFVLDISHPHLVKLVERHPLLIKPNHHEMREIYGVRIDTHEDAKRALRMAHESGVQNVLLTMGSRGSAYFSNGEDVWYARREFNIKLVSSVCAGDCTLAAFLYKWYENRDNVEEALKLAMATGANVAESVGLGDFSHVDEYSRRVVVEKLPR